MATIHPLLFQGTLVSAQGNAIKDAKIQLWQTDLDGNYLHPDPRAANAAKSADHASIVSDFQYFGTDATDSNGNFEFLTYRPGIYPDRPFSHFHFKVWLDYDPASVGVDGGKEYPALVTQFYFADESPPFPEVLQLDVTDVDVDIYNFGSYVNGTIVVDDASLSLTGDTLLSTSPYQPEGPFYPEVDFFAIDNDLTTANDVTTLPTAQPTVAPETAATATTSPNIAPTHAPIALGGSPVPGPTPSNNNGDLTMSTTPTLQPSQILNSSSAAAWSYNYDVGVVPLVMATYIILCRN